MGRYRTVSDRRRDGSVHDAPARRSPLEQGVPMAHLVLTVAPLLRVGVPRTSGCFHRSPGHRCARALRHRAEVRKLADFDDQMLRDIGLTRERRRGRSRRAASFRTASVVLVRCYEHRHRSQPAGPGRRRPRRTRRPRVPLVNVAGAPAPQDSAASSRPFQALSKIDWRDARYCFCISRPVPIICSHAGGVAGCSEAAGSDFAGWSPADDDGSGKPPSSLRTAWPRVSACGGLRSASEPVAPEIRPNRRRWARRGAGCAALLMPRALARSSTCKAAGVDACQERQHLLHRLRFDAGKFAA